MKIVFSEDLTEYTTYTFSYAVYCIQEQPGENADIYARGFLPYTGNTALTGNIFYLARSVRVDLRQFEDTSENRRVNRKVVELGITVIPTEKAGFETENPSFISFCTDYAEERFLGGVMDEQRLRYVLSRDSLSHIFTFRSTEQIVGYVFTFLNQDILHYWYAFFDTAYLKTHALGKWMMWRMLRWAKDEGRQYVYLGTCYKEKALYKIRNHKGIEFFDGVGWNRDVKLLKHLCKADENGHLRPYDLPKAPPHSQEYSVFKGIGMKNDK
jgi:hypothetical protein